MTYELVVRNGLVATATDAIVADLGIRGGRIAAIDSRACRRGRQEIDARGLVVVPGGVDVHTHLDLDLVGTRTADDFESGTAAAACGGVTTICDYAWQKAGDTLATTIENWKAKAAGKAARGLRLSRDRLRGERDGSEGDSGAGGRRLSQLSRSSRSASSAWPTRRCCA